MFGPLTVPRLVQSDVSLTNRLSPTIARVARARRCDIAVVLFHLFVCVFFSFSLLLLSQPLF